MAPAGDFQSAYQALTHGADAIYLGLRDYSARKSAKNVSLEELRRIIRFAHEHHKFVYLAMNTLIREDELSSLVALLHRIVLTAVDGLIVQDLGLAHILHTHFPTLALHGSTQLAVHNSGGVRFLQQIGFSRVVLARELSFEEISSIRKECPDVELKVFIHGALCYGISGMCLASGTILGRSGNRGACGQICRTWSRLVSEDSDAPYGHFFSMKDLSLEKQILRLKDIGIEALKIEGRMKSPNYVAETTSMYRSILDGKPHDPSASRLAFSRTAETGWFGNYHRPDRRSQDAQLVHSSFSGHTGIPAGKILSRKGKWASVKTQRALALRDGLQIIQTDPYHQGMQESSPFSITAMRSKQGESITQCRANTEISLLISEEFSVGETLYQVSGHDSELKQINPLSLPLYTYPLTATITLFDEKIVVSSEIGLLGFRCRWESELSLLPAKVEKPIYPLLEKSFCVHEQNLPFFTQTIELVNTSSLSDQGIFIPPKSLKQLRRSWYEVLSAHFDEFIIENTERIIGEKIPSTEKQQIVLPKRSVMTAGGHVTDSHIFLPLAPIQFLEDSFSMIDEQILKLKTQYPEKQIIVGISNIGQIPWYERQEGLNCFIDYHLYCANSHTIKLLTENLHDCIGAYYWIEDDRRPVASGSDDWGIPLYYIDKEFNPPIFITRTCFRKDSLGKSCSDCKIRSYEYELEQTGRDYQVIVKDCMTYVYVKRP